MGQGASSNLLAQFWEPKKVLTVLMGTLGLLHTAGQQIPTMPAPPSPCVLLATTPGQPHPALSVPGPSPGEQRPLSQLPATPLHLWRTGWSHRMARRAPFQRLSLLARHPQMCEGAWQEPGVGPFERRWVDSWGTGLPGSGVPSMTFQSRCQGQPRKRRLAALAPAMVSQCWSQNENPGLPLWLTPPGKASGMRLLFRENPEQFWTHALPVQWGPQPLAHLLLQACWGHRAGWALQRGPCGQRRGAYSYSYCSRMGGHGTGLCPPWG